MILTAPRPTACRARHPRTASRIRQEQAVTTAVDRVVKRQSGPLAKALSSQANVDGAALLDALERGDRRAANAAVSFDRARLAEALVELSIAGVTAGLKSAKDFAPSHLRSSGAQTIVRQIPNRAAQWAERNGARAATGLTPTSQKAIRQTISRVISRGLQPRTAAQRIRKVIGLNAVQAASVDRRFAVLLDQGLSMERANRRATIFADKLLRQRAQVIAHDELTRAVNQGRHVFWQELELSGQVEGVVRTWRTVGDSNVDGVCSGLDGATAGLEEEFPGGFNAPPDPHSRCRCWLEFSEA